MASAKEGTFQDNLNRVLDQAKQGYKIIIIVRGELGDRRRALALDILRKTIEKNFVDNDFHFVIDGCSSEPLLFHCRVFKNIDYGMSPIIIENQYFLEPLKPICEIALRNGYMIEILDLPIPKSLLFDEFKLRYRYEVPEFRRGIPISNLFKKDDATVRKSIQKEYNKWMDGFKIFYGKEKPEDVPEENFEDKFKRTVDYVRRGYKILIIIRGQVLEERKRLAYEILRGNVGDAFIHEHVVTLKTPAGCAGTIELKVHIVTILASIESEISPIIISNPADIELTKLPCVHASTYGYMIEILDVPLMREDLLKEFNLKYEAKEPQLRKHPPISKKMTCESVENIGKKEEKQVASERKVTKTDHGGESSKQKEEAASAITLDSKPEDKNKELNEHANAAASQEFSTENKTLNKSEIAVLCDRLDKQQSAFMKSIRDEMNKKFEENRKISTKMTDDCLAEMKILMEKQLEMITERMEKITMAVVPKKTSEDDEEDDESWDGEG